MQDLASPNSLKFSSRLPLSMSGSWPDDGYLSDMDCFIKTLSMIQGNGVQPDLIGSIIAHFASKWLQDMTIDCGGSPTAWMKKKILVEKLVSVLPQGKDSVSCDFLLRLLHIASMVGAEVTCRDELEQCISRKLDEASLSELMIPSFRHTCATLLDVELVLRLVTGFVHSLEDGSQSGAALMKVVKLVDHFLAEVAVDAHLALPEFVALASALPSHARPIDDGLYRAIDMYLKAHPELSKQEKKELCNLIDSQKLSAEALLHAIKNERLPVRMVMQVLLLDKTKLNKYGEWNGSASGLHSPGIYGLDIPTRCMSRREFTMQIEIKRLRDDVVRLQSQCADTERKIEKLSKMKKGCFRWKRR